MKKNLIKGVVVILAAILVLSLNSCLKEDPVDKPSTEKGNILVTGTNISVDTKTTLNNLSTIWKGGIDQVGVYCAETNPASTNVVYTADNSTANSTFTGSMTWGTADPHHFYAYYPYAAGSAPVTAVPVSLPYVQTQNGSDSSHVGTYDFMVADPVSVAPSSTVHFKYNHVFTLLKLKITTASPITIDEVKLSAATGNDLTFSAGTIDITQATPAAGTPYAINYGTTGLNEVTLSISGGGVTLTNDAATTPTLYLMILPRDLSLDNVDITVKTIGDEYYHVTKAGRVFLRGTKYSSLITDLGITYREKLGSANSYILNPSAIATTYYAIPITQSNLYWGSTSYGNNPANVIQAKDKWVAQIIWTDVLGIISLDYGGKGDGDGRIIVQVPPTSTVGNALVGIKRDSDGDGTPDAGAQFLWSWHMWVTAYDPDGPKTTVDAYKSTVANGAVYRYVDATDASAPPFPIWASGGLYDGKFIMDRGLGNVTPTLGGVGNLFYQFGRKDPFPSYYATGVITVASGQVSMSTSVNNPSTYYTYNGNWCNQWNGLYIWNDPTLVYSGTSATGQGAKSLFDPCPYGWRLPRTGTYSDFAKGSTFLWEADHRTYKVTGYDTPSSIYNAAGYRGKMDGIVVGYSTEDGAYSSSPKDVNNGLAMTFNSANLTLGNSISRASGYRVRCVQQ